MTPFHGALGKVNASSYHWLCFEACLHYMLIDTYVSKINKIDTKMRRVRVIILVECFVW